MNEAEYEEFKKRYDKFKKNNLPTPFFDETRQTEEYVYFEKSQNQLEINNSLTEALGDIVCTGFYYSFTSKYIISWRENDKYITKVTVEHNHAHSFEDVVKALYDSPESFSISKEEEQYYSKQELEYLRRVQKYLLFIGMKDLETRKAPADRYKNKIHSKYENAYIYKFNDEALKNINDGIRNFRVIEWFPEYSGDIKFKPKEYQALIVDKEDNFKMFVEFTMREVKDYKDIKDVCTIEKLKDEDKVIVTYFKILETF